ncbi:GFA family protein [Marinihelvus fidelis]|uniref:GFA family protein n=1 Tax=Marinihelvus fidelis TaxID=2613842 RepID=A0A5N0TCF4_9GAMM|nr:GFA family protein [Marinihelvus fidelis]KAA9132773.1 GFA family protein [Marinihelvus fidelis]
MTTNTLSGSCLCGAVRYQAHGDVRKFYHCHCKRCRKATGTGHASNLFIKGTLEWLSGEEQIGFYKLPEAERFSNTFCSQCGSRLPKAVPELGAVMVPAGTLDDEPDFLPQARIFRDSRAAWSCDESALPTFAEYPE